ncbi:LytTR family DNA-binding domain-containing protein [Alteriqipengyuania sp.]
MRLITTRFIADRTLRKHGFVNRARGFANWLANGPGMPLLPVISFGGALIGTVAGAFNTGELPFGQRLAFWLILMGMEAIKWLGWLRWQVKQPRDYWRAALIGTPLLGLFIPLEIAAAFWLVGIGPMFAIAPVLLNVAVIGVAVLLVILVVLRPWRDAREAAPTLLQKEGVAQADILAVSSEDHYCRLYLAGGSERLIHARLVDIVELLDPAAGTRIHRSHWCSDKAVTASRRAGRGWELIMPSGAALRVSATYREEAQRRGWLSRNRLVD